MDSANIILGYKNPVIPTPAEMENERLTINTLKNQNAASQRQMQMQKELQGITDPNQAVAVISKYDPIKGMELRQKMQEQAQSQSKDKRAMAVEGIGFYGKQAGIISNIYDDSIKAGLTPEQAQQKVMPLFQNAMSQGAHLYPDLPVSGDFDIDKIKQSAMQADDFLKQYNESKVHLRDRSEKALDTADEREYQTLKTKQANNFDLSKIEVHRLNDLEKLKIQNNFTAGQNAASRAVTMRGQNMAKETSDTRAREASENKSVSGTPAQKQQDAKDVLSILKQAAPLIDKSTNSGFGNAVDSSLAFFGKSTSGAQNSASLKALEGSLVSKMPKMSGPQSDKDVLLYKQMAGQIGDPNIPAAQKKSAMNTILKLNSSYLGVPYEPLDFSTDADNNQIKTGAPILDKNSPAAQMPTTFKAPPNPSQYNGKTIVDDKTGVKLRSNGKQWIKVK